VHQRQLAWDGCLNVRDLGGHATEGANVTKFGRVVRADSARRLTAAGWSALVEYGIRTIVDLRFHEELEADPPFEVPVEVVHVPAFPALEPREWAALDRLAEATGDPAAGTKTVYLELLERYPAGFARAVAAVAQAADGGVLVHCTAGKDRTGLVTALVLRIVGVSIADVAADYALSDRNLAPLTAVWIAEAEDELEQARRRRLSMTPAAAMAYVFDELERRHGGAASYLRAGGVSSGDLRLVRERLLV
jgi:protein-tyrosine phosphatase